MIAVLLAAASPVFAPPEGQAFRFVVERTTDGATPRRFRLERRVLFLHDDDGVAADVTLERTEQTPPDAFAARFAQGNAPFVGRRLRFHFARDGAVRAVDGGEAAFAALVGAMGALAKSAADPLLALPPERRLAMVANIAQPFVAGADTIATPGSQPVTIASALPGGGTVQLTGTRTVARDAQGRIVVSVHATGDTVVLDRIRIVDTATGLVLEQRETQVVTVGGVARTSRSVMTIQPTVS